MRIIWINTCKVLRAKTAIGSKSCQMGKLLHIQLKRTFRFSSAITDQRPGELDQPLPCYKVPHRSVTWGSYQPSVTFLRVRVTVSMQGKWGVRPSPTHHGTWNSTTGTRFLRLQIIVFNLVDITDLLRIGQKVWSHHTHTQQYFPDTQRKIRFSFGMLFQDIQRLCKAQPSLANPDLRAMP